MTIFYSNLNGKWEDGARLFSVVPTDRTREAHTEVQETLSKHQETLYCEGEQHWQRLIGEVVEFPSLEIFKSCMDIVLGSLLLSRAGRTRRPPDVPSNLNHSVIL